MKLRFFVVLALFCVFAHGQSKQTKETRKNFELVDPRPQWDDPRGLYAVWYSRYYQVMNLPYIKGGQIFFQWPDFDLGDGRYDFSALDERMEKLYERKIRASLNVGASYRPAWIFEKVPYYTGKKWSEQSLDPQGVAMYWHPAYVEAYCNFLDTLARHIKASPYREVILGMRMNLNAIGTEHVSVPKEVIPLENWVIPDGVTDVVPFESHFSTEYKKTILKKYAESFPPIRVFVRNNLEDEVREAFLSEFESGKLGWTHTSGEVEPRGRETDRQYQTFMRYCRTGKTLGYTEPWADAWGRHALQDKRFCPPAQWNYWMLLSNLNMGISYIGIYGSDLMAASEGFYFQNPQIVVDLKMQQELTEAFEFASKYAGYHTSPKQAPGAWVAFRHSDKAQNNDQADNKRFKGDPLTIMTEDYSFLALVQEKNSFPLIMAGPTDQRFGTFARRIDSEGELSMVLHPDFAESVQGKTVKVKVIYLDNGKDSWAMQWGGRKYKHRNTGSGLWKTAEWEIKAPKGANGPQAGLLVEQGQMKDFHTAEIAALKPDVILSVEDGAVTFHMIEIERL